MEQKQEQELGQLTLTAFPDGDPASKTPEDLFKEVDTSAPTDLTPNKDWEKSVPTKPIQGKTEFNSHGQKIVTPSIPSNEYKLLESLENSKIQQANSDGTLTDYGRNQVSMQQFNSSVSEGMKPIEAIDKVAGEDKVSRMNLMSDLYHRAIEAGQEPATAAKMVGLDPAYLDRITVSGRYKEGLKKDSLDLRSGAVNIFNDIGTKSMEMQSSYTDEDLEWYKENGAMPKLARKYKADSDKQDTITETTTELYRAFGRSYNRDGSVDTPWDLSGTAGESTIDMAIGGLVAASIPIKGAAASAVAYRQGTANVVGAIGTESLRFGDHHDPAKFALGLGGALAGESLALIGMKRLGIGKADANQVITSKSLEELDMAYSGLKMLEEYDIKLSDFELLSAEAKKEAIIKQIGTSGKKQMPIREVNEIYEKTLENYVGLMEGMEKSIRAQGFKSMAQIEAYHNGTLPWKDLPLQVKEMNRAKRAAVQAKISPKYDELQGLDINPKTGNPNTYNVISTKSPSGKTYNLSSYFGEISKDNKTVGSFLQGELRAIRGSGISDDVAEGYQAMYKSRTAARDKVVEFEGRVSINQEQIKALETNIGSIKSALAQGELDGVSTSHLKQALADEKVKLTSAKKSIGGLKTQRGNQLKKMEEAEVEYDEYLQLSKYKEIKDEVSVQDLVSLRKAITHKLYVAGGNISTNDELQKASLHKAMNYLDGMMDDMMGNGTWEQKEFLTKFRLVTQEAKEGFNIWGSSARTRNVNKVLEEGEPEKILSMFKGEGAIGNLKALRELDADKYNDVFSMVVNDKIYDGVKSATSINAVGGFDFAKYSKNVREPALRELIINTQGEAAYKELLGTAWLGEAIGEHMSAIIKKTGGIVNTQHIKGMPDVNRGSILGNLGLSISRTLEHYTKGVIGSKWHSGNTKLDGIALAIKDTLGDVKEVVGTQANFRLGLVFPNMTPIVNDTYTTSRALKEVKAAMKNMSAPETESFLTKLKINLDKYIRKDK